MDYRIDRFGGGVFHRVGFVCARGAAGERRHRRAPREISQGVKHRDALDFSAD